MTSVTDTSLQKLFGDPDTVAIERALAEIRSGRPVIVSGEEGAALTLAAESVDSKALAKLRAAGFRDARLVLSPARLRLLGHDVQTAASIEIENYDAEALLNVVCQADARLESAVPRPAHPTETAGLELVRLGYLLPAAIVMPVDPVTDLAGVVRIETAAIEHYRQHVLTAPHIVSRAPVPLEDVGETEFVVFRGGEGMRDQVAVIVGNPDPAGPVFVRIHSACLTGDLFASLKCDCGDQLRGTVKRMAETAGGVLLYLDQEGRGNGIANKIRAYKLQHAGYDTYEADEILGFDLDQRRFDFAAAMLRELGFTSVKLMTNNPEKVAALREAGLDVVSSHRVMGRSTEHNVSYLETKRDRAGHILAKDLKV
ncbi:MAG: GTP cyclohydrolase II RibA [Dichotomicrobium sp.]